MKTRLIAIGLTLAAFTLVVASRAQDKAKPAEDNPASVRDELATKEQQLSRQFAEFESQLLRLAQRLEKSAKTEDRDRAKLLRSILEESKKESLGVQFERLSAFLRDSKLKNVTELKELTDRSDELANKLRRLIDMFRDDPRQKLANEERKFLEKLVKEIQQVIQQEKQLQGLTEIGKTDHKELKNNQGQVKNKTDKLAKSIDKYTKNGADSPPKEQPKGDLKEAGKLDGSEAKAKDDGEKDAQTASADPKAGEPKSGEPKAGEPKPGEAKPGQESQAKKGEGDPKSGEPKDGKGADTAKAGEPKDSKGQKPDASAKGSPKPGDPKSGDPKSGEPTAKSKDGDKPGSQAKAGSPGKESSPGSKDSKPSESAQAGEPKAGKSGPPSPKSQSKQGQAKAGDKKDGQSQAKDDGAQKADPQDTNPQGAQTAAQKGEPKEQDPNQQANKGNPPPKENQDLLSSQKKIKEAGYDMAKAEDKLGEKKNKEATKDQQSSIDKLEAVKEQLEKLLRQKREEEMERLLAALQARCEKMLAMQMSVLAGTEQVHKAIEANADKKANRQNQQDSIRLSDNEKDIVTEANKAIMMLEEEGSAVAFPEVFQQVREDMKHVQRRLEVTDAGEVTQTIEKDIIASLKEMIDALKKARQELDQQKNPPSQSPPSPPPDQKLLDQIAELKMIRSLQKRVNDRTQFYGKLFPGEQAADVNVRQDVQRLAERQERIFDITNRIAKGDNR